MGTASADKACEAALAEDNLREEGGVRVDGNECSDETPPGRHAESRGLSERQVRGRSRSECRGSNPEGIGRRSE